MTRRISVVGTSGTGKTTLAGEIALRLAIPHVELDAIFHQPDWQPLPTPDFRAAVDAATARDTWVVDGNYRVVRDIVWARADTVVWLDYPRPRMMARLVRRTLRRIITGEELWNGNRERWRNLFDRRPEHNIILWGWTNHRPRRAAMRRAIADPANDHLRFVTLGSPAEASRWLRSLSAE